MATSRTGSPARSKEAGRGINTILLVEDDSFHLELMVRSLSSLDDQFKVETASDFAKAQAALDEHKPRIVVSDLRLPDGSALDFLTESRDPADFALVVITSQGNENLAVQAIKAGAMDYLVKSENAFENLPLVVVRVLREWEVRAQRNQALKDLYKSEERFRATFESTTEHMAIKNARHEYIMVNPAMADFFGMTPAEMEGLTDEQLFGASAGTSTRDWEERALTGKVVEEQHERKVKGEQYVFLDTRVPLRDSEGNIMGLAVISRDITQRLERKRRSRVSTDMVKSKSMRETMELIEQVSDSNATVLLLGESGSGKDYLARWLHDNSRRSAGPFFSVDCATIGESLAESILFGHERGAFTNAVARKKGLVELAEGGTLLLNEIGELPLQLQAKLLTFLDTMSFVRLGGEQQIKVDVRLLAATHRDLGTEVAERKFLTPLYYRLNVISIRVPSLRERKADIPGLITHIMAEVAARLNLSTVPRLDDVGMDAAVAYDWPGNVRELKNIIERSLILWRGGKFRLLIPEESLLARGDRATEEKANSRLEIPAGLTMKEAVNELKKQMTIDALRKARGGKSEAARLLDVSRDAIYRFIRDYGIDNTD